MIVFDFNTSKRFYEKVIKEENKKFDDAIYVCSEWARNLIHKEIEKMINKRFN